MLNRKVEIATAVQLLFPPSLLGERDNSLPQSRFERVDVLADEAEATPICFGANAAHDTLDDGQAIGARGIILLDDLGYFLVC